MHGHVDSFASSLVSIVQKMVAYVVKQVPNKTQRHDVLRQPSEQNRNIGREDLLKRREYILRHPDFLIIFVLIGLLSKDFTCFLQLFVSVLSCDGQATLGVRRDDALLGDLLLAAERDSFGVGPVG